MTEHLDNSPMADWYEVFDNEQVQFDTRQRVARLVVVLAASLALVVGFVPVLAFYLPSTLLALGLGGGVLLGVAVWASQVFLRLRSVVWCVKLSVHRIVGYDYARRKSTIPWTRVERVDLDAQGLVLSEAPHEGIPGRVLRIPHLFPDYAALSHRVVEYAEAHGLPVCVNGRPWQFLDLPTIYPFMAAAEIAGTAGSTPGRALEGDDL